MMGRFFDEDWDTLITDLIKYTTCVPWVKSSIAENDVWVFHKIFLRILSSKVSESPIILWGHAVKCFTLSSVFFLIPGSFWEHRSRFWRWEWHGHFIARKYGPAIVVKTSALLNRDIKAWFLVIIIVESLSSSSNSIKIFVFTGNISIISCLSCITSSTDWPRWKWFNEIGWIGIIYHSHSANWIIESAYKTLNLDWSTWHSAEVENLAKCLVSISLLSHTG